MALAAVKRSSFGASRRAVQHAPDLDSIGQFPVEDQIAPEGRIFLRLEPSPGRKRPFAASASFSRTPGGVSPLPRWSSTLSKSAETLPFVNSGAAASVPAVQRLTAR